MLMQIKQDMVPIQLSINSWALPPYQRLVWEYNTDYSKPATTFGVLIQPGYTTGLLKCYIDFQDVDLETFDKHLEGSGWTRNDIVKAINSDSR